MGFLHKSQKVKRSLTSFEILKGVADSKGSIFSHRVDIKAILQKIPYRIGISQIEGRNKSILNFQLDKGDDHMMFLNNLINNLLNNNMSTQSSSLAEDCMVVPM